MLFKDMGFLKTLGVLVLAMLISRANSISIAGGSDEEGAISPEAVCADKLSKYPGLKKIPMQEFRSMPRSAQLLVPVNKLPLSKYGNRVANALVELALERPEVISKLPPEICDPTKCPIATTHLEAARCNFMNQHLDTLGFLVSNITREDFLQVPKVRNVGAKGIGEMNDLLMLVGARLPGYSAFKRDLEKKDQPAPWTPSKDLLELSIRQRKQLPLEAIFSDEPELRASLENQVGAITVGELIQQPFSFYEKIANIGPKRRAIIKERMAKLGLTFGKED